jgi:hypothetical protein
VTSFCGRSGDQSPPGGASSHDSSPWTSSAAALDGLDRGGQVAGRVLDAAVRSLPPVEEQVRGLRRVAPRARRAPPGILVERALVVAVGGLGAHPRLLRRGHDLADHHAPAGAATVRGAEDPVDRVALLGGRALVLDAVPGLGAGALPRARGRVARRQRDALGVGELGDEVVHRRERRGTGLLDQAQRRLRARGVRAAEGQEPRELLQPPGDLVFEDERHERPRVGVDVRALQHVDGAADGDARGAGEQLRLVAERVGEVAAGVADSHGDRLGAVGGRGDPRVALDRGADEERDAGDEQVQAAHRRAPLALGGLRRQADRGVATRSGALGRGVLRHRRSVTARSAAHGQGGAGARASAGRPWFRRAAARRGRRA